MTNKQIIEEKKKELERCKNKLKNLFLQNRTTEEIMFSFKIRKLEREINELEKDYQK